MKKKILLTVLLLVFLAETAWGADYLSKNGEFWIATCSCQCKGVDMNASAVYKGGFAETQASASTKARTLCHEQCARSCGGYTNCSFDNEAGCKTCCQPFCAGLGDVRDKCELSCSSTCSYRGLVNSIVNIMVTSQDPNDRSAAKNGIIFVIIALIIIILAATLVGVFLNSAMTPAG
jgi:hypothetical protein